MKNLLLILLLLGTNYMSYAQDFAWDAEEQVKKERLIIDTLKFVELVFDLEDNELFEFAFLDSDIDNNLVAYDFGREKIIYLANDDYQNIQEISNGRGRGPGELGHVFDVKFDKKGSIWVADLEKHEISNWSPEGDLKSTIKPGKKYVRPAKLGVCESNFIYILSEQYISEGIYHAFDKNGEPLSIFKTVQHEDKNLQSNMRGGSYSDGRLECHENDLIHVGSYKNYIRRYSVDGKLIYSVKSISQDNPEPLLVTKGKWTELHEDAVRLHRDIDIEDGLLYVGYAGKKGLWMYILDVYDITNAEYLYSFKFKNPVQEFSITGNQIFVTEYDWNEKDTDLAIYSIPKVRH